MDPYLAALDRVRAVLAETTETGHDHRGPGPCPRCGGAPPDKPAATSYHPVQQRIEETP